VQSTLGVGGCGNICFGHVLFAVRQGQRRDAAATREEQLGGCAARKNKYTRLYMYSGKLVLAATYLRRVFVDGRSFAAGAPALAHVFTVGACGTKPHVWVWSFVHAFSFTFCCRFKIQNGPLLVGF
jgi:hypothetical protein